MGGTPDIAQRRVHRGGAWRSSIGLWLRVTAPDTYPSTVRADHTGFRTFRPARQERYPPP